MKKQLLFITMLLLTLGVNAKPLVVEDFEGYAVGTKWTVWGVYGAGTATATVAVDPQNSSNHVLRVQLNNEDWGRFATFQIPADYKGAKLNERFTQIRFRMFRPTSDTNDYKQLQAYYGSEQVYCSSGYPYQGDRNVWQNIALDLGKVSASSTATNLSVGIHCDKSDYYIDDVTLAGPMDDFNEIESGKVDFSANNTSSSYASYSNALFIPEGTKLDVYTARYTDFESRVAGPGTLNIYGGGERVFLGNHSTKKYQDWSYFTGDVHIYPYKAKTTSAGFYGVIMVNNGKDFSPSDIEGSLMDGKVNTMMGNNKVTLHAGATIAFESSKDGGNYAAKFGELNTEAGSLINAYMKNTSNRNAYILVGGNGTDALLAGRIAPQATSQSLGLVKDGKGTYTITANDNQITGAVRVLRGRVNVSNDMDKTMSGKLSGGTGTGRSGAAVAYVYSNGVLGGTGNVAGLVENYGTIEPGTAESTGTLTMKDYTTANANATLSMHPASRLRFKIKDAESYDRLVVNNAVKFSNQTEEFSTSEESPVIRIALAEANNVQPGDEFVVLTAASRTSAETWQWKPVFPESYTWAMEERTTADGYQLVVKVVSLDNDPANAGNDQEEEKGNQDIDDSFTDTFTDDGDVNTLRHYADQTGKYIGVAVPVWRGIDLYSTTDARVKMMKQQFNMVEPENCMKWDATEPSQNNFTFGGADALVDFAQKNNMYVRGHALAWHSQVAGWVSSDGKKNDKGWTKAQLMAILKNHVMTVASHFKGKIGEWDVVNECLDDDQSIVSSNPTGYKLRTGSVWTTVCGEAFIDSAFVWAHRADPSAKLYLNDYSNETKGKAKTEAFYNLAKRLKNAGIPIDGVGFQCHLDAGGVNAAKIKENLARYAEIGLECTITELDLGMGDDSEPNRQQQARDYYRIVEAAMSLDHCGKVLIWGLTDDWTWREGRRPLLWDAGNHNKPAFYAVRKVLRMDATDAEEVLAGETGIGSPVVQTMYYNMQGQRMAAQGDGITIVVKKHADGTVTSMKLQK